MSIIGHFLRKEFAQLRRDKKMLPIVFVAPILQLFLLGYAANLDVDMIPMAVLDNDNSVESRRMIDKFVQSGYFSEEVRFLSPELVDEYINQGQIVAALVIPPNFQASLTRGEKVPLQLIVDGADANTATIALNYADIIVSRFSAEIQLEAVHTSARQSGRKTETAIPIAVEPRVWYNPELKSRNFMVPGILALLLMVTTMILTSLAIVKEKEQGTLEHLNVTPIKPFQLIIGKLAPFALIGMVDVFLVLGATRLLFGLVPVGSVLLLVALSAVFLLSTLGLGLLVSTLSRNQQQAMMSSLFFVMLPMIFLSGFAFPIENMPKIIQYVTYALPLRYYFVIIRGIFLKGAGLSTLWDESLMLLAFGLIVLGISIARFRKQA
ncbi:MAG: ABC transporter permease [Spirochaetaceae bacterium]|nr:ABC transporter permease [Spirochaetaceae bacterium]MCF7947681.1 ABC transporter permease [Spirochaetia bacterium]MCF7950508.1 ABC transporter permease [Spirochaetaceae bacterium]